MIYIRYKERIMLMVNLVVGGGGGGAVERAGGGARPALEPEFSFF